MMLNRQLLALLTNALFLVNCDAWFRFYEEGENLVQINDTRKLLQIVDHPPILNLAFSYRFVIKESDDHSKHSVMRSFHHMSVNGTELANLLELEDPTVEELAALVKEISLKDISTKGEPSFINQKFKDSNFEFYNFGEESSEVSSKDGYFDHPTERHDYTLRKYASAVFPTYILIGILSFCIYVMRRKIFHHRERLIKFSNVSSLITKVLIIRLVFDTVYLVYLALFAGFNWFSHKGFFFFFVIVDQLMELAIFHATMSAFVQGYLTLHFDKKVLWNKFAMVTTLLYTVSIFAIKIYVKGFVIEDFYYIDGLYQIDIKGNNFNFVIAVCVYTIACRIALFVLILRQFWISYKESNENEKFLKSAIVILIAYFLSPYIKVPVFYNIRDVWEENLKQIFIGDGDISLGHGTTTIPEIIQLFTGALLIYLWRDTSYKSLEDQDSIELE